MGTLCVIFTNDFNSIGAVMNSTRHWAIQRLTAILLLPLSYWLLAFLKLVLNANYFEINDWIATPLNKIALIAWFLVVFYHAAIGLQVVLEDYISNTQKRLTAIWIVNSFFTMLGLSTVSLLFFIG